MEERAGRRQQVAAGGRSAPASAVDPVTAARELVGRHDRIVALTGAGISTESGIPDFRGPEGVWTKDPGAERRATLQAYVGDPELRRASWRNRLASSATTVEPNGGHRALVALERAGRLAAVVTQNVDGLHHAAGQDPGLVIELHGNIREVTCLRCGHRQPIDLVLERVRAGDEDPSCLVDGCGGILKSATISFGQDLVAEDLRRAEDAARSCDLLLVVGTSLGVYPAAGLVPLAVAHGHPMVIVNAQSTPYDDDAAVVVRGAIGEVLPAIATGVSRAWDAGGA